MMPHTAEAVAAAKADYLHVQSLWLRTIDYRTALCGMLTIKWMRHYQRHDALADRVGVLQRRYRTMEQENAYALRKQREAGQVDPFDRASRLDARADRQADAWERHRHGGTLE